MPETKVIGIIHDDPDYGHDDGRDDYHNHHENR
jgi:hypothetical protein